MYLPDITIHCKALLHNNKSWRKIVTSIKCHFYHFTKITKMWKMVKMKKAKMWKRVKILRLLPPMSISALKPGPVVPPGTQKVPDQAARISQSVSFGHLSDILGFLRGGHFFHYFLSFFTDFNFITFHTFSFSWFVTFSGFLILSIFVTFLILMILSIFTFFNDFDLFLSFAKGILKIRPSFDPFS